MRARVSPVRPSPSTRQLLLCMVNGVACIAMSMAPSADGMELRIASSSLAVVSTVRIPRDSDSAARKRGTVPENRIAFGLKTERSSLVIQIGLDATFTLPLESVPESGSTTTFAPRHACSALSATIASGRSPSPGTP
jgi:hypothetical protein